MQSSHIHSVGVSICRSRTKHQSPRGIDTNAVLMVRAGRHDHSGKQNWKRLSAWLTFCRRGVVRMRSS